MDGYRLKGGTFTVPVSTNNRITLNFVLDSGAADVSIPADVVPRLMRTGTLSAADFLGEADQYASRPSRRKRATRTFDAVHWQAAHRRRPTKV